MRRPPAGKSWTTLGRSIPSASKSMMFISARIPGRIVPRSCNPYTRAVAWVCLFTKYSSGICSPLERSRAQWVSKVVGELASQISPTCAPASATPQTLLGDLSMVSTALRSPEQ